MAGCAAKIYINPAPSPPGGRRQKLEAMLKTRPRNTSVGLNGSRLPLLAWPTHLVEIPDGSVAGFLMPLVDRKRAVRLTAYTSGDGRKFKLSDDDLSLPRRIDLCRNLASLVDDVHQQGHFIVDLKPANAFVFHDTGIVCFIDTDSFSVHAPDGRRYPAPMFTPEYACAELASAEMGPGKVIDDLPDRFSLAVLMFQILNGGIHPFQGVHREEREQYTHAEGIKEGLYAYGLVPHPRIEPMPASMHDTFPLSTRQMFDRAFGPVPSSRPAAREWRDHWQTVKATPTAFAKCSAYPAMAAHIHFAAPVCPHCRCDGLDQQERAERIAMSNAMASSARSASAPISGVASSAAVSASAPAVAGGPGVTAPLRPPSGAGLGRKIWRFAVFIFGLYMLSHLFIEGGPGRLLRSPPAETEPAPLPPPMSSTEQNSLVAMAMRTATDEAGLRARGDLLRQLAEGARTGNAHDLGVTLHEIASGADQAANASTLMRNAIPAAEFSKWQRFVKDARELNARGLSRFRSDPAAAAEVQQTALALNPLDREIAGNLGYYLALSGRHEAALDFAVYALALERAPAQTGRSADWQLLGSMLALQDDPNGALGAYLVALKLTNNLAGFCRSLRQQQRDFGPQLQATVERAIERVAQTANPVPDDC